MLSDVKNRTKKKKEKKCLINRIDLHELSTSSLLQVNLVHNAQDTIEYSSPSYFLPL